MYEHRFNRRSGLQLGIAGALGGVGGWNPLAAAAVAAKQHDRHCVILWMSGGPSQIDTFDLKPGHTNGGASREAATSVPGLRFSEQLPQLAKQAESLAILRGLSTREGDHERGTILMQTGHPLGGPVNYPAIGCALSKALGDSADAIPDYVTIAPGAFTANAIGPGFLGPQHAAMSVNAGGPPPPNGYATLQVEFLRRTDGIDVGRHQQRLKIWRSLQADFIRTRAAENVLAHDTIYEAAIGLMESETRHAFDLSNESDPVRQAYGRGLFGQGCLMARRLIERGVPLVEVTLGEGLAWDTHTENFQRVRELSEQLDAGWGSLMSELDDRGLLERTTILWAGEFGRTPTINPNGGRDHFPQAFTCVLAGGGIAGGQAFGATSADGMEVVDGKINEQDLLATLCRALGVSPHTENIAGGGRPVAISDGNAVTKVLR